MLRILCLFFIMVLSVGSVANEQPKIAVGGTTGISSGSSSLGNTAATLTSIVVSTTIIVVTKSAVKRGDSKGQTSQSGTTGTIGP